MCHLYVFVVPNSLKIHTNDCLFCCRLLSRNDSCRIYSFFYIHYISDGFPNMILGWTGSHSYKIGVPNVHVLRHGLITKEYFIYFADLCESRWEKTLSQSWSWNPEYAYWRTVRSDQWKTRMRMFLRPRCLIRDQLHYSASGGDEANGGAEGGRARGDVNFKGTSEDLGTA